MSTWEKSKAFLTALLQTELQGININFQL